MLMLLLAAASRGSESLMKLQHPMPYAERGYRPSSPQLPSAQTPGVRFVTGMFEGRLTVAMKRVCNLKRCRSVPSEQIISSGGIDLYLAKYDPNDNLVWVTQVGGAGDEAAGALTVGRHNGLNHMRRPSGEDIHDLAADSAAESLAEQSVYLGGVMQGMLTLEAGVQLSAGTAMNKAPFLAKYNSSDGGLHWARTVAQLSPMTLRNQTNTSHTWRPSTEPPRTDKTQQFNSSGTGICGQGDDCKCTVDGVAVDGQGSVLMVGRLLGKLTFPQRLNFTTLDREYLGSLHAVKLDSSQPYDPIELAIGLPTFEQVFSFSNASFTLEVEQEETAGSLRLKLSEALQVPTEWINLLVNDGSELPVMPIQGQKGYNMYKPKEYAVRWALEDHQPLTTQVAVQQHLRVQICNSTWVRSMKLLDRNLCAEEIDALQASTYYCPSRCTHHADCVSESMCIDSICQVAQTVCANISTALVDTVLESPDNCVHRASTGTSCVMAPWLAQFDADGLLEWADLRGNIVAPAEGYQEYLKAHKEMDKDPLTVPTQLKLLEHEVERGYWALRADELWEKASDIDPELALRLDDNWPAVTATGTELHRHTLWP